MKFRLFLFALFTMALIPCAASQNSETIQLVGVGTTSALTLYSRWFREFEKMHPDIHFSYMPSGSEAGINMITSGAADFGATDAPVSDRDLTRGRLLEFATVLGAIVPIYNVPGAMRPLKFSPRALAGIYLGTITRWNDPIISSLNPDAALPAASIAVIHSADGRGATYIWSDYLSKVNTEWRTRVGRGISIEWPVGKEADGNGNLARLVRATPNSIGYVSVAYAAEYGLPCGQVQNAAGNFISAAPSAIVAAAEASAKGRPTDSHASLTNPSGPKSYPIASFSWILISEKTESSAKQTAVKEFVLWMLDKGQLSVEDAGFARPPKIIIDRQLDAIEKLP